MTYVVTMLTDALGALSCSNSDLKFTATSQPSPFGRTLHFLPTLPATRSDSDPPPGPATLTTTSSTALLPHNQGRCAEPHLQPICNSNLRHSRRANHEFAGEIQADMSTTVAPIHMANGERRKATWEKHRMGLRKTPKQKPDLIPERRRRSATGTTNFRVEGANDIHRADLTYSTARCEANTYTVSPAASIPESLQTRPATSKPRTAGHQSPTTPQIPTNPNPPSRLPRLPHPQQTRHRPLLPPQHSIKHKQAQEEIPCALSCGWNK